MKKILMLMSVLFSCCQLLGSSLNWNAPETISGTGASDPQIVIDLQGNANALWVEGGFIKSSRLPAGGSWSAAVNISGSSSSAPKIGVAANGDITAVWLQGTVIKAALRPAGGNWGIAVSLSGLGTASSPVLAVDSSGNAVAAWVLGGLIQTSTRLAGGLWGLASSFLETASDNPSVAAAGGYMAVVWHRVAAGQDQILASRASIGGIWGGTQNLVASVASGYNHNYPKVTMDTNGDALAIWFRSEFGGYQDLEYINVVALGAGRVLAGAAWDTPIEISNIGLGNPSRLSSKIRFDSGGNAIAVWSFAPDGSIFNIEAATRPIGRGFPVPSQIIADNPYAFQADVSIDTIGNALVGYMAFDGADVVIDVTESEIASYRTGYFTIPQTISTGSNNGFPRVANSVTSSTSNAVVVWVSSSGGNQTISAATGSKTIIAPPTSLSVVQGVNNYGVFSEYYNTISWLASADPNVIGYVIYRNGIYIEHVDRNTLSLIDHNRVQNGSVVYGVAAFHVDYQQSNTVYVAFP